MNINSYFLLNTPFDYYYQTYFNKMRKSLIKTILICFIGLFCACQMGQLEEPGSPECGKTETHEEVELLVSMPAGMTRTSLGDKGGQVLILYFGLKVTILR